MMIEKAHYINAVEARPIQPHCIIDRDWIKNSQADFAQELIRFGVFTPAPGDASGARYQQFDALTVKQVVTRACDAAAEAFAEFERRGWLIKVPLYDDLVERLKNTAPTSPGFLNK